MEPAEEPQGSAAAAAAARPAGVPSCPLNMLKLDSDDIGWPRPCTSAALKRNVLPFVQMAFVVLALHAPEAGSGKNAMVATMLLLCQQLTPAPVMPPPFAQQERFFMSTESVRLACMQCNDTCAVA